jgi:hypothetical protein
MVSLFIALLLEANYKSKKWQGIVVERGQVIFGRKAWSQKLGISERSMRTCLEHLKTTNEVTIKTTNKYSIITVVKYEEYQPYEPEPTSETTSNSSLDRPATDQQPTTPKESKKERIEELKENFNEFWKQYVPVKARNGSGGRKGSKPKAEVSYRRVRDKGWSHDEIMRGTRYYLEGCRKAFCPSKYPVTFLNDEIEQSIEESVGDSKSMTIEEIKQRRGF